ncbi:hypothetical protein [Agrococcus sp. ARC_14]|uniref:hypothetical protein n=1 Tax=Agrococcus sp. ARC_14 TaxID=2919927 RepID=UPI001F06C347|nr:hypothetical protein [Agrococcus sp. ARC_14]MCH1883051.1 hypothetical protein [Agrococcus sp. ARC_14]
MQLYSSRPIRAFWQVVGDLVAIGTIVAAIWISQQVRDAIASLGAFGTQIEDAGAGFSTTLTDAGQALAQVPLVGEGIAQPFVDASGSADDLAAAGTALRGTVDALATTVSTALWLLPVLFVVLLWLVPRLRFATRAGATKRLALTREGRELLALRALVGQPAARVLATVPDPIAAFRSADAASLDALAALELRASGVAGATS